MKTQQKNKSPSYWTEAQNLASGDSSAPTHGASEDLAPEPIKSVNATVLQIKGRIITIRVPNANLAELAGKVVEINGLKATGVRSIPSSEADDGKTDFTDALIYRLAEEVDASSLAVESVCEVTWE